MTSDSFSRSRGSRDAEMQVNGLKVTLNLPRALSQEFQDGEEIAQALPEYAPRAAFVVDEYPACPGNWVRGSATEASYFVPVVAEHGLWLDFNANSGHTHHVAVLISIQRLNGISGRKVEGTVLEQFRKNCPEHNEPFGHERFCERCGYKWPPQNYMASNAQPRGYFWIDGFRAEDGVTRQFVFTEEEMRGIAAQVIGKERVFAIGIAFFLSKESKPQAPPPLYLRREPPAYHPHASDHLAELIANGEAAKKLLTIGFDSVLKEATFAPALDKPSIRVRGAVAAPKRLEIAAGAKIDQRTYRDPEKLDFWQTEPAGLIFINYVTVADAQDIIAAGKRDMTAGGEGFLQGLRVGHPA